MQHFENLNSKQLIHKYDSIKNDLAHAYVDDAARLRSSMIRMVEELEWRRMHTTLVFSVIRVDDRLGGPYAVQVEEVVIDPEHEYRPFVRYAYLEPTISYSSRSRAERDMARRMEEWKERGWTVEVAE